MISVLIPTRGRPDGLRAAIYSMVEKAARPAALEFLLAHDEDDKPQEATCAQLRKELGELRVNVFSGPRLGYRNLHLLWNLLAQASTGDWIINWNDDTTMVTPAWDSLLRQGPVHTIQFLRRDILDHADTTFPCTSRSVYKAMGHISFNAHADDWLARVAEGAGIAVYRDDIVFHHERLNDQTSHDRDHGGYDMEGFKTPEMMALRAEAIERVKAVK